MAYENIYKVVDEINRIASNHNSPKLSKHDLTFGKEDWHLDGVPWRQWCEEVFEETPRSL